MISKRLNFSEPMSPQTSSEDRLLSPNVSLKLNTSSSAGSVSSRTTSAHGSLATVSQGDSHR